MYFLGLIMYVGFSGQLGFMFFVFIWKLLSWMLVLDFILIWFWFIQVCISSLVNNLGFSCINNMFLWVLILEFWFWTKLIFDTNHDIWVIIKANEYLILDLCLIANKTLSFISWNLVWFNVYVAKFELECYSCSSFSLVFNLFLLENFMFFFCIFF
jgi:hypothetical protein